MAGDETILRELAAQMAAAAQSLRFEHAAGLRDVSQSLSWLSDQLQRLRQVRQQYFFIYPVSDQRADTAAAKHSAQLWYLIHGGQVVRSLPAPHGKLQPPIGGSLWPALQPGLGVRMRGWCDKAGLPHCSSHGLRKAGAALAENGATEHQLMAIFGWSTIQEAEHHQSCTPKEDGRRRDAAAPQGQSLNKSFPLSRWVGFPPRRNA